MRFRFPRLTRYPTTSSEWLETAQELGDIAREVMAQAAAEMNEDDLAREIAENRDRMFPMDRYKRELNRRVKGAGDRAERRAGSELRRRRS